MKGFDHIPEPTPEQLEEAEPDDFDGSSAPLVIRSLDFESNQEEYERAKHAPADDDQSPRARLHRNARDQSRIEHDTNWAQISKAGSFLTPRGHRDKERDKR